MFLNGPADGLQRSRQWAWGRGGFVQANRNGHFWQVPSTGPRSIMKDQDRLKTMPGSGGPSVVPIMPQTGCPHIMISESRPYPGGETHIPFSRRSIRNGPVHPEESPHKNAGAPIHRDPGILIFIRDPLFRNRRVLRTFNHFFIQLQPLCSPSLRSGGGYHPGRSSSVPPRP